MLLLRLLDEESSTKASSLDGEERRVEGEVGGGGGVIFLFLSVLLNGRREVGWAFIISNPRQLLLVQVKTAAPAM